MTIRVRQIVGDTIELAFNSHEDDLRIGESLWVGDTYRQRGIIAQIIEFRTPPAPSLWQNVGSLTAARGSSTPPPFSDPETFRDRPHGVLPQLALAKIRRRTDPTWRQWDGWIPGQDAIAVRMTDEEVLRQCVLVSRAPLKLGNTSSGERFHLDASALESVNIIAGGKETHAIPLAALLLHELVRQGIPCVVFDSTGELSHFCRHRLQPSPEQASLPPVTHLRAGENLRLDPRQMGSEAIRTLLSNFGLPKLEALACAHHLADAIESLQRSEDASGQPAFITLDGIAAQAIESKVTGGDVLHGAFLGCLKAIQETGLLARNAAEATPLAEVYEQLADGGALMLDMSGLPARARPAAVQSYMKILQGVGKHASQDHPDRPPCVFLERAHLYVHGLLRGQLLERGNPSGMTMILLTDRVDRLADSLLGQTGNLFVAGPISDEARQNLGKAALTDRQSLHSLVQRLQDQQTLVVGTATKHYPIIIEVDAVAAVHDVEAPRRLFRPRRLHGTSPPVPSQKHITLPLFPEEEPVQEAPLTPATPRPALETLPSPSLGVSLAHLTAQWPHLVKRAARRRRILDTILSTAWPLQVTGQTLVVGFPPQHRLQRELFDSPEYRSLLEDELAAMFGQAFAIETVLHPASTGSPLRS